MRYARSGKRNNLGYSISTNNNGKFYNVSLNLANYISSKSTLNDRVLTLLIDSGADISQIEITRIDTNATISLNGIGKGITYTIGKVHADLKIKNLLLIQPSFRVVQDDFPIPSDGMLGLDFLKKYNCILDYQRDQDWLVLRPEDFPQHIAIPMRNSLRINSISLPERSEVIRFITVNSTEKEVLIPHQELQSGIFVAIIFKCNSINAQK